MNQENPLFRTLRTGAIELPHRVLMAPLTRGRSTNRIPNDLMAEYYSQRASAGLIISEATAISEQGYGWHGAPGIYSIAQIEGWKKITNAVHTKQGKIFLQLWHMGRVSHPDYQNGSLPVAPSAVPAIGEAHTPTGKKPFVTPHALTQGEITCIVEDYATATRNAREAGFDGVEVHAANGYLIDQFLRDASNLRKDQYGGTIANRIRFLQEVVTAVTNAWSADRTGVRISPTMAGQGMADSDPIALFIQVAKALNHFQLAYLHVAEAIKPGRLFNADAPRVTPHIRKAYDGVLFANGGYDRDSAAQAIRDGEADAIAFGQLFIANPDLPQRFKENQSLNVPEVATYYSVGPHGYTDYPELSSRS